MGNNKVDYSEKLTPFDSELFLMVESLTDHECIPKFDADGYSFTADYEKFQKQPEWIMALWDAIEGRTGERLLEIEDNPDLHCLLVRVKYSEELLPHYIRLDRDSKERAETGDKYARALEEIRAIQVRRENVGRLLAFVGNGEMEIEKRPDGKATFHFRNAGGSVYAHAPEFSYIVYVSPGRFKIVGKEPFEKQYEKK